MALVEIDEAELAAKNRVVNWVNGALADPKTRKKALQLAKERDPTFTAPELEQDALIDDRLGKFETRILTALEARETREQERDLASQKTAMEQRWLTGRKAARDAGHSDEGIAKLEEFMETNGIIDHGLALPAFERLHPPPEPVATGDNRWGFFDVKTTESPDLKPLFEGRDEDFLRTQIAATLAEVRGTAR
jgi:hypothetical protein